MNTEIGILYVEDDAVDRMSVQREFEKTKTPVTIYTAKSGIEALRILEDWNKKKTAKPLPKAILLDINLPQMNGIEFLSTLRSKPDFNTIQVFIVTSTYTKKDKLATQSLDVSGCIVKPVQHSDAVNILWSISTGSEDGALLF